EELLWVDTTVRRTPALPAALCEPERSTSSALLIESSERTASPPRTAMVTTSIATEATTSLIALRDLVERRSSNPVVASVVEDQQNLGEPRETAGGYVEGEARGRDGTRDRDARDPGSGFRDGGPARHDDHARRGV